MVVYVITPLFQQSVQPRREIRKNDVPRHTVAPERLSEIGGFEMRAKLEQMEPRI
jgi:hypothetical protein